MDRGRVMLRHFMAACAALFALLVVPVSALAQAIPAEVPRVNFPFTNVGNITTFGPTTADAANAKNFSFGAAANGSVFASGSGRVPTAGGSSIPITVGGTIPKATAAAAIGRFLRRGIPLISTAAALYELADDLGFGIDSANQSMTIDTGAVAGFDGYKYGHDSTKPQNYKYTKQLACDYMATLIGTSMIVVPASGGSGFGCMRSSNTGTVYTLYRLASAPPASNHTPATPEQIADLIAANSNWPDSTALALAGTVKYAIQAGEALNVAPDAVTGPATSPGTSSVVNNVTNNTTTTNTETHNHAYAGNQITTNTTRTSITIDNSTGAVVNSSTSTESPVLPETPALEFPCGIAGTPPCAVKVDETDVPEADTIKNDQADHSLDDWDNFVSNIASVLPTVPNINWAFALPTFCGPIPLPSFEPWLTQIDICGWQPMFHQIMTLVWSLGGLFGAISLFMRSSLSTN